MEPPGPVGLRADARASGNRYSSIEAESIWYSTVRADKK